MAVSAEIRATVMSTSVNNTMLKKRRITGDYKSPGRWSPAPEL
jgi:hypothetical protein